jgi:hypothetical protein
VFAFVYFGCLLAGIMPLLSFGVDLLLVCDSAVDKGGSCSVEILVETNVVVGQLSE